MKTLLITILMAIIVFDTIGQTVILPDTNFRNKLLLTYPQVMTGNELNIAAANSFSPDLIIDNCNISDLTGVEHFTNIVKLNINGNHITSIPDISGFKKIQYLYLNKNKLTSLPKLSTFTKLKQFQAADNLLTTIPSLDNCTLLTQLYLSVNKLTSLPDLSRLTILDYLAFAGNEIDIMPDISKNVLLTEIQLHETNISVIPNLGELKMLKKLSCYATKITNLNDLDSNTVLEHLNAFETRLETLPYLLNKPNLGYLNVHKAKLTFDDFSPFLDNTFPNLTTFIYANQDSVGVNTDLTLRAFEPLKLNIYVDSKESDYVYNWYNNNILIGTTSVGEFIIPSVSASNSGKYSVRISNLKLPNLILQSRIWNLTVLNCMDLIDFTFDIITNECALGATVNSFANLLGAKTPISYSLVSKYGTNTALSTDGEFKKVAPGIYTLIFSDVNNCSIEKVVTVKKPTKCDLVISFNGDSPINPYFIEEQGTVKVLDLSGKIVNQFECPAIWNATKSDGSLVDSGFYILLLNNKKLTNISVLR